MPTLSSHEDPAWGRYCEVLEEANRLEQDLEAEGDSDGPGPGGLPTLAELEWDPAGDLGNLRPLGQKAPRTPGAPCELCGHRSPEGRGLALEDALMLGLSHRKHLAGHRRRSLILKSQLPAAVYPLVKKRQAPPDVILEVESGAPARTARWPLILLFLVCLLVGATLLWPRSGDLCCPPTWLAWTPYLVLSYVNGPPPT
ncbi:nesprin-4 [Tenrec ecaudatus]|uniref:nesprin-4 n=1 Tax=Tenrec ecaudatus TaxID=94439 RepID=UPI003F5A374C